VSAIESEVLEKFEKKLVDAESLSPDLAKSVRAELASANGPNSERLADLFKNATNGGPA
jgi:hypothetical protein